MSVKPCPRAILGGTLIDGTGRKPVEDSIIVIEDEWIFAVGKRGEVEIPEGSELIDATGKTVLPGFIDAHNHFVRTGIRMSRQIDLSGTGSLVEAVEKTKKRVEDSEREDWVMGRNWDESKWIERRYVTKKDLDSFSQENPVMLTRICGHLITLNSKALEITGITGETPDPPGGRVDKDETGEPTGVLMEARQLVEKFIPGTTEAQAVDGLEQISDYALSVGCTGVHDAGLEGHEIRAYQTALEQGKLKIRAYLLWSSELVESMEFLGLRTGFGNEMVRLGSAKMLIDGSIGARTAALFEPYEDDPSTKGLLRISMEELVEKIKAVHNQGSQVAVHAIGDYAVELAMNAIEEALKGAPRKDHRHRIEHCELLSSSQIERIKQLGIVASMQPNFVGNWSHPEGLYDTRLGKKRLRQNNPYRILLDEEITVAFGSDCMPFNPLYGIWSAVNHPIRMHRISLEEAVRSYTLDVAYTSFEEEIKGSIEPGKLADITVVEEDLTKIDSDDLKEATIQMTILNGKILYHKE